MKPRLRLLVPPVLLALLLSVLWRDLTPLARRLPYGTRTVLAVNDPLARLRKVLGSRAFAAWEEGAPEGLPREVARRLKNPGLPVALFLAGIRQAYWIAGGVPDGGGYREFRLVALDVALLPLLTRVLARLPDVERDGAGFRVGDQRIVPEGDVLWIGDAFSARVLADVADGKRDPLAARNEFAGVLLDALKERADFAAAFLTPKPILDGLAPLGAALDPSAVFDRAAFGGATLHGTIDAKGARVVGMAINRPERSFLPLCVPVTGGFSLPAGRTPPRRYVGVRVDRAERLSEAVAGGLFRADPARGGTARDLLGKTFVRAFLANFGDEAAAWTATPAAGSPSDAATVVALRVKDRAETERYLLQARQLLRQDRLPGAAPDAIQVGPTKAFYRLTDALFVVGTTRERIDAFLAAPEAKTTPADAGTLFGVEDVRPEGCVVGYADLGPALGAWPAFARFAGLSPKAALSIAATDGALRLNARVAFDNPIRPVVARSLTIARAVYLSVAATYLVAVVLLAALTVRNAVRFARARKASAAKVGP